MKEFREWLIARYMTPEIRERVIRLWLRESPFEQIRDMVRQECSQYHLSRNPKRKKIEAYQALSNNAVPPY